MTSPSSSTATTTAAIPPFQTTLDQMITVDTRLPVINNPTPVIWCHKDGTYCTLYDIVVQYKYKNNAVTLTQNLLAGMNLDSVFAFDSLEKMDYVLVHEKRNQDRLYLDPSVLLEMMRERYIVKLKRV